MFFRFIFISFYSSADKNEVNNEKMKETLLELKPED